MEPIVNLSKSFESCKLSRAHQNCNRSGWQILGMTDGENGQNSDSQLEQATSS